MKTGKPKIIQEYVTETEGIVFTGYLHLAKYLLQQNKISLQNAMSYEQQHKFIFQEQKILENLLYSLFHKQNQTLKGMIKFEKCRKIRYMIMLLL